MNLTNITIPNSVISIGNYAFYYCVRLSSVNIPTSIDSIATGVFKNCTSLNSITIPDNVVSIGEEAFYSCKSLNSIYIGSGVNSIGKKAFGLLLNLPDVYCNNRNVPDTHSDAFADCEIGFQILYVPNESIDKYREVEPWKNFGSIIGLSETTPKCEKPSISYNNGQLKFACATEGVEFVSEITDTDIKKYNSASISLTATYNISVYATKSGYENSETATATLCWIDVDPKTEGITNTVANVRALPLLIQNNGSTLTVSGANDGTPITVYSINGTEAGSAISQNGAATIPTTLQSGSATIVKVGNKSIKVVMK